MTSCTDKVLELYQGDDWAIICTLRNKATKAPIDLTGASNITVQLKKTDGTFLTKQMTGYISGNGIVILSATGGKIQLDIPRAETALLKPGEFLSLAFVVTQSSKEKTYKLLKGLTILIRQNTRGTGPQYKHPCHQTESLAQSHHIARMADLLLSSQEQVQNEHLPMSCHQEFLII